jgi:ABC-type glycerol-3-phosphate transport system substrate-binding protein
MLAASAYGGTYHAASAARWDDSTSATLSVYTCCGSLAGFEARDTGASDMHTIYGGLWSHLFPSVTWQETAFADQATLEMRLAAAERAGEAPDIVFIQGGDSGFLVLRRLVQPLDRYYAQAHVAASGFLPAMARWARFGGHWWAIPAVSGPLGGQQIYLPQYMSPLGYDNHNLRTFADYLQMSRLAVRFDAAGNLTRIGYWPGADTWETTATLMCPRGHGLYDAADQPTATDPCNVAYLDYLQQLASLYGGYDKLTAFLSRDPDFLTGDRASYLVSGKALVTPSSDAYWNLTPFDAYSFGVKGGLRYALTPLPPTLHGTEAEVATYPSTMQEVMIPSGARHPDLAFAVSKAMFWDNGYLLGLATSGSPIVKDQQRWLGELLSGEGAVRVQAGLQGNPFANLAGVRMQPQLGLLSDAASPTNPVDPYYQQQLALATDNVLHGLQSPQAALQSVQRLVLAQERRLQSRYGRWNW